MKKKKIIDRIRYNNSIKMQNLKTIKKIENLICFNEENEKELKYIKSKVLKNSSLAAFVLILTSIIVTIISNAVLINLIILTLTIYGLDKIRVLTEEKRKIKQLENWVKRLTPIENEELEYLASKLKFIKKNSGYENEYMRSLRCASYREHVKIYEPKKSLRNFDIIKKDTSLTKENVSVQSITYVDNDIAVIKAKNKTKIKSLN